ncbi:MAG: hypothetical protein K6G78_05710 [bacterium]|nr:hypothetical protein [bacterium]
MSLDDEIRKKRESMQAAVDEETRNRAKAKMLQMAFKEAGMHSATPILRMPDSGLQAVIAETMPSMTFTSPKKVKSLPDGTTRVRPTRDKERADEKSFDVLVKVENIDKSKYETAIWFFKNGSVAYSKNGNNIESPGVAANVVREKIIEKLAGAQVVRPRSSSTNSNSNEKKGGCYVATAVYGSYDCPEVWVLRRYRDYVLQPTWYGKLFISLYYAISPHLVKLFGNARWFQGFWRKRLDAMTDGLKAKGFSDEPYDD